MNEFEFEPTYSPWELALSRLKPGDSMSASRFLTLVESGEELSAEDAALELEQRGVMLELSDLPGFQANPETQARLDLERRLMERGCPVEELDPQDPLGLYLREIRGFAPIADGSELAASGASGDEIAMRELTNGYLGCVLECAREFVGRGVLLMDLLQEGSLGLWQGILAYRSGSFREQALWWIRQAMARAVVLQAQVNGVGQNLSRQMTRYEKTDRELLGRLHRNPTDLEIAEEMGITLEDALALGKMLREVQSLAKLKAPQEEPEEDQPVEDTAYYQQRQRIDDMLTGLTQQEEKLIRMRFGLDGKAPMTAQEVGRSLSMTESEVVALETAALAKMRREDN